jgi:hypothetical protein
LTVNNNTTDDSVIFLVGETGSIAIAYVRAGETFQIIGVPRGDYNFFYTLGSQWNGRTFNHGTQQGKLKKSLDYQVYSEHEVTIYKTVGPRDQSEAVNDGTFPIIPATDPEQP